MTVSSLTIKKHKKHQAYCNDPADTDECSGDVSIIAAKLTFSRQLLLKSLGVVWKQAINHSIEIQYSVRCGSVWDQIIIES